MVEPSMVAAPNAGWMVSSALLLMSCWLPALLCFVFFRAVLFHSIFVHGYLSLPPSLHTTNRIQLSSCNSAAAAAAEAAPAAAVLIRI